MSEAQKEAALARARDVIARVERTLAVPRPGAPAWLEEAPVPPLVEQAIQPAPSPPELAPPSAPAPKKDGAKFITWDAFREILKDSIAPSIKEALSERDSKIEDISTRLAAIEALLAKAKGSTQ